MILDGHVHITSLSRNREAFIARLNQAGIDGALLISLPPGGYEESMGQAKSYAAEARLEDLLYWRDTADNLYGAFWIDPLEVGALAQVSMAAKAGIEAFKVICSNFSAGDKRALRVFHAIAEAEKPILFHSGILWDGTASSAFNRPAAFEPLLEVAGLRFSLAHIGWPWTDEMIAVYGKFLNAHAERPDLSVEMFVDLTPGTPPIYRREALIRLFHTGYDVEHNVIFGLDSPTSNYGLEWARDWMDRDNAIYDEIGLSDETRKRIYGGTLLRFLGLSAEKVEKRIPVPGQ
ncbi:amidohydrolase family protein [bacterium]|nr:amidohydrolase family protein [bacterium]